MRAPLVCLRELSAEEAAAVESLARSRTAAARRVERARIVWRASQGETPPSIAEALSLSAETVRRRIRRFNAEGLAALEDHYRSGRPATYLADAVATVIAAALTSPQRLGLPFAAWTLDRLAAYLREQKGIAMRRSRIDEILLKEGLRWRQHETWFGERVDPAFAEKRGGSRRSTPRRLRAA
jgi:transposase